MVYVQHMEHMVSAAVITYKAAAQGGYQHTSTPALPKSSNISACSAVLCVWQTLGIQWHLQQVNHFKCNASLFVLVQ